MDDTEKPADAKPSSQASVDHLTNLGFTPEDVDSAVEETANPKPASIVAGIGAPVDGGVAKWLLDSGVGAGLRGVGGEAVSGLKGVGASDFYPGFGVGNVGLIGDLFKSPPYTDFAKGITTALAQQKPGYKFIDASFVNGLQGLLQDRQAPFIGSLALQAFQGFKSDLFVKGLADGAMTGFKVPTSDLFVPATPSADKAVLAPPVTDLEPEVIEATVEQADIAEPLPTAVVEEIHEERTFTQEAFVAALREAVRPKRTRLESFALWATVIGVPLGILAAILIAIFL